MRRTKLIKVSPKIAFNPMGINLGLAPQASACHKKFLGVGQ
jgi:hypothetical protein